MGASSYRQVSSTLAPRAMMLSNILIVLCANAAGSREPRWDSLWSLRRPRHIDVRNHRQRAADAQTSRICRLPKDAGNFIEAVVSLSPTLPWLSLPFEGFLAIGSSRANYTAFTVKGRLRRMQYTHMVCLSNGGGAPVNQGRVNISATHISCA